VSAYGGTERVIWYLGKELVKLGHQVTYLVNEGSRCDFAKVVFIDSSKSWQEQIPKDVELVHFNFPPEEEIQEPYIVTIHGNSNDEKEFDLNSVFVSQNHAQRFGSDSFVYNGLDWNDYGKVDLGNTRKYFHFLGNAAWRVKNVKGAIDVIDSCNGERLAVVGGDRLNFRMGIRITLSWKSRFYGMLGGEDKLNVMRNSKGLIFPVRWNEPFGLAIIESLYFGCPVFATPYGSLPELVNAQCGYLSSSKGDLVKAVKNAHQYSKKYCHEYASDLFNAKKMALSYLEKYEQVLNGKTLNVSKPKLKMIQSEKFLEWRD